MKRKIMTTLATLLALTLLLTACGQAAPGPAAIVPRKNGAVGSVLLSLNPEIEIEYDRNGIVVELEGLNEDGRDILLGYVRFEGKTVQQVMGELVEAIYASGKYQLEMDGNAKNIVIKLLEGSAYPSEEFLEEVAESIRLVVSTQGSTNQTVVVGKEDLNEKGLIGLEKAKELVLTQLGLTEADFTQKEYGLDDGVYELEFTVNGVEYEYDVHGYTGKILKAETETEEAPKPPSPTHPATAPPLSLAEAKALVFAQLDMTEADVKHLETDFEQGRFELEFTVNGVEYDVEVDAATGTIVKLEKELDNAPPLPPVVGNTDAPAPMTAEEVKALILSYMGFREDQIRQLEIEVDDGNFEVSFKLGNIEYEFEVDITGKILKSDWEHDD